MASKFVEVQLMFIEVLLLARERECEKMDHAKIQGGFLQWESACWSAKTSLLQCWAFQHLINGMESESNSTHEKNRNNQIKWRDEDMVQLGMKKTVVDESKSAAM